MFIFLNFYHLITFDTRYLLKRLHFFNISLKIVSVMTTTENK